MRVKLPVAIVALILGAVVGIGVYGAIGASAASGKAADHIAPPVRPPWFGPNGDVIMNQLPSSMIVSGPDGKPLHNPDGTVKTIDPRPGVPPLPAGQHWPTSGPVNTNVTEHN